MPIQPSSTLIAARSPIVDDNKMATWSFLKVLQDWDMKLTNGLNSIGQITQPIPDQTGVTGRDEGLGTTLQNIDTDGVLLPAGIDFARSYVHKDTDHIGDATGHPLAGGKVAYATLVASHPIAGQTIRYDGADWLPVAIAQGALAQNSFWISAYDSTTGMFTQTQPNFTDLAGHVAPTQGEGYTGTIVTAKLTLTGADGHMTFQGGFLVSQSAAT